MKGDDKLVAQYKHLHGDLYASHQARRYFVNQLVDRFENKGGGKESFRKRMDELFNKDSPPLPQDAKDKIDEIRSKNANFYYPQLNEEPSLKGITYFSFIKHNNVIEFQQIFGQGLIQDRFTVSVLDRDSGLKIISLWRMAVRIFGILQFAKKFYNKYSYNGVLIGEINLTGSDDGFVRKLKPSGRDFWEEDKECLLNEYRWEIKTDTNVLNSAEDSKKYFIDLLREIYWDLGFEDISEDIVDDFLKQSGLSFESA